MKVIRNDLNFKASHITGPTALFLSVDFVQTKPARMHLEFTDGSVINDDKKVNLLLKLCADYSDLLAENDFWVVRIQTDPRDNTGPYIHHHVFAAIVSSLLGQRVNPRC